MKTVLILIVLGLSACATGPIDPVNANLIMYGAGLAAQGQQRQYAPMPMTPRNCQTYYQGGGYQTWCY